MISDIMRRISLLNTLKKPTEKEVEELDFYKTIMRAIIVIFRSKTYITLIPIKLSSCSIATAKELAKQFNLQIVKSKDSLYLSIAKEVKI